MDRKIFSCYLIGEHNSLIQCAEILLAKGHQIKGIVSPLESAAKWAKQHQVSYFPTLIQTEQSLLKDSYDYLFSIVNSKILPSEILNHPGHFAINYHFSLLPQYAGEHATSWAILNNEKTHGISWHIMNEIINGGDILKQVKIPIAIDETTLSLNIKCMEQAVSIFSKLVDELASHAYQRYAQDLSQRIYRPFKTKSKGNGWIDWRDNAEDIERLCRAMYFGDYPNRFGLPKFKLGQEVFIIKKLMKRSQIAQESPGLLLEICADKWQIATGNGVIDLLEISNFERKQVSLVALQKKYNLTKGVSLELPATILFEHYQKISAKYHGYELFWVNELKRTRFSEFPFLSFIESDDDSNNCDFFQSIILSDDIIDRFLVSFGGKKKDFLIMMLSLWLIYLYKIGNHDSVGINILGVTKVPNDLKGFITDQLPLMLSLQHDFNFKMVYLRVKKHFETLKKHYGFLRDIYCRFPELKDVAIYSPISVAIADRGEEEQDILSSSSSLILKIFPNKKKISWYINKNKIKNTQHLKFVLENVSGHLKTLIKDISGNYKITLKDLKLLTPKEYQQIVYDWNMTEVDYSEYKTLVQLFEKQVDKTPNHIALEFSQTKMTYHELNGKANQLACYLRKKYQEHFNHPLTPDTFIPIIMRNGIEAVISMLGILKAGAAYVPIDPDYPTQRILYILENSCAVCVLTKENLLKKIQNELKKLNQIRFFINVDRDWTIITQEDRRNLNIDIVKPNYLAYMIYTSGTTGNPKGVMIEHRNVVNTLCAQIIAYNISEVSRVLQNTSLSFDNSVTEVFGALLSGATLVIPANEKTLVGDELANFLINERITILVLTPAVLASASINEYPFLKTISIGGEVCTSALMNIWSAKFYCLNTYGPTESAIEAISKVCKPCEDPPAIGKPIPNVKAYVLDRDLQPVPMGVIGELYLGGAGLARGYFNLPKLTMEKFINNPFATEKDKINGYTRLYKTGDLVRWLPTGDLDYKGRNDFQIKIHGYRIELEEIESVLTMHPHVGECVVTVKEFNANKYLVVYWTSPQEVNNDGQYVNSWKSIYESQYSSLDSNKFKNNINVWISSYTGAQIDEPSMVEWVNETVSRIKQLGPKIILEIGSGSGLILFNLIDFCDFYYATDFSENAINYTKVVSREQDLEEKIAGFACAADEIPYQLIKAAYDTVIFNSVIQHFPNIEYLQKVIIKAIHNIRDKGQIFIGDVRDLRLLQCFHYSVRKFQNREVSQSIIDFLASREKELLVAPVYFFSLQNKLSSITQVEILPKMGDANTEMNIYRYDIILHINKHENAHCLNEALFTEVAEFKNYFISNLGEKYQYIKYPNKRVLDDYIEYAKTFQIEQYKLSEKRYENILSLNQIKKITESSNYKVKFFLDIHNPLYLLIVPYLRDENGDIFIKYNIDNDIELTNVANNPGKTAELYNTSIVEDLKNFLQTKLPAYMVPEYYINMEKLPISTHGKIDRAALPSPSFASDVEEQYFPPKFPLEIKICHIWQQLFNKKKIGVRDDFFDLGGNSILAIQFIVKAKKVLNVDIKISELFTSRTIENLCKSYDFNKNFQLAIPLNKHNNQKNTMIMIHPGNGGGCEVYIELARSLEDNFYCLGIDNYNLHHQKKIRTLSKLAQAYLNFQESMSNKDNYYLLGWSLGGQIALEMAAILESRGITKITVFLLDSFLPDKKQPVLVDKQIIASILSDTKQQLEQLEYDKTYITRILSAMRAEILLLTMKLSRDLHHTKVILFKAMQIDRKASNAYANFDKLNESIFLSKDNNINQYCENVQIIFLKCNHSNILVKGLSEIVHYVNN